MIGAKPLHPDSERPPHQIGCDLKLFLIIIVDREVVQAGGGVGMAGAERLFADGERPFIQRAGRRVVPHRLQQPGQVVQALGM